MNAAGRRPVLGVSISDPPPDELTQLGLTSNDVRAAILTPGARAVATGWSIAHGGDLRHGGFTRVLIDLVRDSHADIETLAVAVGVGVGVGVGEDHR